MPHHSNTHRPFQVASRRRGSGLVLGAILLASLAGSAHAAPSKMFDPGANITEYAGDTNNLAVNCVTTPDQLVLQARRFPAVQAAMQEFDRRGYVAVPGADTAVSGCAQPISVVALAYRKPGAWIDSNHVAVPTIVVKTQLNTDTGEPLTTVTGGMLVIDGEAQVAFSGDSLAMFSGMDHSFDVLAPGSGGRVVGGGRGVIPEGNFDFFKDPDSRFNRYMTCLGWSAVSCILGALRFGGPSWTRVKIALMLEQPEIGLAIISSCAVISSVSCMGRLR